MWFDLLVDKQLAGSDLSPAAVAGIVIVVIAAVAAAVFIYCKWQARRNTDMWTSLTMESYLGVTCHYTDSNTELGSVVLGVSKFPKSHTADNIKKALSDLISDWGLTGSVAAMVTDNAANMVSAIQ
ncbi:zinc finger BED domain-containing 1-like protein [Labeo rohita]|uniref:Zinc finger BED domain-containing 1-like protein n=1 Tax=Labeo rohita TaxID=84645 RepID=A0A498ME01_LABRO|nr:zinc finger BED domain-containing 1-like protein [Labeo rohita]